MFNKNACTHSDNLIYQKYLYIVIDMSYRIVKKMLNFSIYLNIQKYRNILLYFC